MARLHKTLRSLFADIADSIRNKIDSTATITADKFPEAIRSINSDVTATASNMLNGVIARGPNGKVIGSIVTKTPSDLTTSGATVSIPAGYYASDTSKSVTIVAQATPSISIDSDGWITASVVQESGYVEGDTKSAKEQLAVQPAQTIMPGTSDQTIDSSRYLTGVQTIKGDPNLIPDNIIKGVSIFGVQGTGGAQYAAIVVIYPEESDCICSNGEEEFEAPNNTGKCVFIIPSNGIWTVTATKEGFDPVSKDIEITSEGQVEILELTYRLYLYRGGDTCDNITNGWGAQPGSLGNVDITKGEDSITITHSGDTGATNTMRRTAYVGPLNNNINFTKYNKLVANFVSISPDTQFAGGKTEDHRITLSVLGEGSTEASLPILASTDGLFELDVSEIIGAGTIQISSQAQGEDYFVNESKWSGKLTTTYTISELYLI